MSIFTKAQLRTLQISIGNLEIAKADIEEIRNAGRDKFDGRSGAWQADSEAGQTASCELDWLDEVVDSLDTTINNLTSIEGTQT